MAAYAVKHIAEEQGPLLANLKTIRKTPHSYTSREPEASDAPAGGGVWKGGFKFRNSSTPGDRADGVYFEVLPQITDVALCEWLATQTPMAVLPQPMIDQFEAMIDDHAETAKDYA